MLRSSTLTSKVKQIKKKRALVAHVCSGASVVSAHCVEGVMVVAENHLGDGGGEHGAVVIRDHEATKFSTTDGFSSLHL